MLVRRRAEAVAQDGGLGSALFQALMGVDHLLAIMKVATVPLLHVAEAAMH